MRLFVPILPVAALLLTAAAPDEAALEDARCLLALGQLGSSEDPARREAGQMGAQFYFGRLDGRAVPDLEALLNEAAAGMKPEDLDPILLRCAATMQERGQALQAIGDRMNDEAGAE